MIKLVDWTFQLTKFISFTRTISVISFSRHYRTNGKQSFASYDEATTVTHNSYTCIEFNSYGAVVDYLFKTLTECYNLDMSFVTQMSYAIIRPAIIKIIIVVSYIKFIEPTTRCRICSLSHSVQTIISKRLKKIKNSF